MTNLAPIFTRCPVSSLENPGELASPCDYLTQREWEASIAAGTLAGPARTLLRHALLLRATAACIERQCERLERRVERYRAAFLSVTPAERMRALVLSDLVTIWHILDLAPGILPGMLRGLLLVCLGIRLRQALAALEKKPGGQSAEQELRHALEVLNVSVEAGAARHEALWQQRHEAAWKEQRRRLGWE